jgi:hypothetical protein
MLSYIPYFYVVVSIFVYLSFLGGFFPLCFYIKRPYLYNALPPDVLSIVSRNQEWRVPLICLSSVAG